MFVAGLLLAQLAAGAPALAQGNSAPATKPQRAPTSTAAPSTAADPDQEVVRLYNRGVEAVKAKQWEKAREALLEAFKRKPLPQIAANLGYAEFMWGRFRDAAEHMSFFLREGQNISAKDRQDMEKRIADAKAKIGTVTVRVNVDGAKVLIDAHEVGVSPVLQPLFVEPGSRVFEAHKGGLTTERHEIEVAAGAAPVVELTLVPLGPSAQGSALPPHGGTGVPVKTPPVDPARPAWKTPVIGIGVGLAIVGIGLGIGFSAAAIAKNDDVLGEVDYLVHRTKETESICPRKEEEERCTTLTQFLQTRDTYRNVAIASFAVGGVGAVGAIVAGLWKPSSPAPSGRAAPSFMIVPSLQGVVVTGSF